jgi:hypothetical protein
MGVDKQIIALRNNQIRGNLAELGDLMVKIGSGIPDLITEVQEGMFFNLISNTILATPVKTGRLRANYQISIVLNDNELDKTRSPNLGGVLTQVKKGTQSGFFWFFNNLDYFEQIEAGSSLQAPQGMLRESIILSNIWARRKVKQLFGENARFDNFEIA